MAKGPWIIQSAGDRIFLLNTENAWLFEVCGQHLIEVPPTPTLDRMPEPSAISPINAFTPVQVPSCRDDFVGTDRIEVDGHVFTGQTQPVDGDGIGLNAAVGAGRPYESWQEAIRAALEAPVLFEMRRDGELIAERWFETRNAAWAFFDEMLKDQARM